MAPYERGTLQFQSLAAPGTLRHLPHIVKGRAFWVSTADGRLRWPDVSAVVDESFETSGVPTPRGRSCLGERREVPRHQRASRGIIPSKLESNRARYGR